METSMRARFTKEYKAIQASFLEDGNRFKLEVRGRLPELARAADFVDGLRKEVMKGLCYHSWTASRASKSMEQ